MQHAAEWLHAAARINAAYRKRLWRAAVTRTRLLVAYSGSHRGRSSLTTADCLSVEIPSDCWLPTVGSFQEHGPDQTCGSMYRVGYWELSSVIMGLVQEEPAAIGARSSEDGCVVHGEENADT